MPNPKLCLEINIGELLGVDEYLAELEVAKRDLMDELAKEGAKKAREYAPVGPKNDKRTRHLKDAITSESGASYARFTVKARHGLITEYGGGPSEIPGNVYFYWDKMGRFWNPGTNIIHHPPTRAQPFMRPAFDDLMLEWHEIAKRVYP